MQNALSALGRRIALFMSRALITLVDDTQSVQRIQARINSLEAVSTVPRYAEYGFTSNPPLDGTEALILFGNGDRTNGIVICTANGTYRMKALKTGEVAIHDNAGKSVLLSQGGIIIDGGNLPVTIKNTPKVRAETDLLECTGDIVDNCDTTGRSMAADRAIFDGHTHPVTNVQAGSDTVESSAPTQQE